VNGISGEYSEDNKKEVLAMLQQRGIANAEGETITNGKIKIP